MILYGLRHCNTGPARTISQLCTSAIVFRRAAVKTIDIWQIELLDTVPDQVIYGRTPLLFKKGDNLRIDFILKRAPSGPIGQVVPSGSSLLRTQSVNANAGVSGNNDFLMFLGKVVEKIGDNVTG